MCTVVALHRIRSDFPLVIAANRDEYYARAASRPALVSGDVLAGRDLVAGGTWLGAHRQGLVVAITNQRTMRPPAADRRSRGALVAEALDTGSVEGVLALLRARAVNDYNPFNLLFGDGERLFVAYARDDLEPRALGVDASRASAAAIVIEELAPGIVVLANDRIDSPDYPKTGRARALVEGSATAPWANLRDALEHALGDHERPPPEQVRASGPFEGAFLRELQALCIHTPLYGTRSSTIVALSAEGEVAHYLHADGPPCTSAFEEHRALLAR
jgi:uncharacterized protein with NRDE domain